MRGGDHPYSKHGMHHGPTKTDPAACTPVRRPHLMADGPAAGPESASSREEEQQEHDHHVRLEPQGGLAAVMRRACRAPPAECESRCSATQPSEGDARSSQRGSVKAAVVSGVAMAAIAVAWQCIRSRDVAAAKPGEAEAWMGEAAERLTIQIGHQEAGGGRRPACGWPRAASSTVRPRLEQRAERSP